MLSDEYYIEDNRIYNQHNRSIVKAIKEIKDPDLMDILNDFSVSGKRKNSIFNLCKFLEKDRKLIELKLGKEQSDALFKFANTTNIRHNKDGKFRNPSNDELQVFFDFGASLARLIEIWKENT